MTPIPDVLFRGDGDRCGVRKLKATIHHQHLLTNLTNGGDGRWVYAEPAIKLADKHVSGWSETHFLSFSESRDTALSFGLHCELEDVPDKMMEMVDHHPAFDFALVEFRTSTVTWTRVDDGVYTGIHDARGKGSERLVLIDSCTILANQPALSESYSNAARDQEWLLLPANPVQFQNATELSGIWYFGETCIVHHFGDAATSSRMERLV